MKKILLIAISSIVLINISCSSDNDDEQAKRYSKNFIAGYVDNVKSFYITDISEGVDVSHNILRYQCQLRCDTATDVSEYHNIERFKELARYYKDTSYNNLISMGSPRCLSEPLLSISVISDTKYDDAHPAGIPLDDIVRLRAFSPFKFIQSAYTDFFYPSEDDIYNGNVLIDNIKTEYFPINKQLNELDENDLILLCAEWSSDGICLIFPKELPVNKEHNITVTVKFKNGKILTTTGKIVFPQE